MPRCFLRRRWDEVRGDEFDEWGSSVWYFEVDDNSWPVRQVEVYDNGPVLRYGSEHPEDRFGFLGRVSLDDSGDDWSPYVIGQDEFERIWLVPER